MDNNEVIDDNEKNRSVPIAPKDKNDFERNLEEDFEEDLIENPEDKINDGLIAWNKKQEEYLKNDFFHSFSLYPVRI